MANRAQFTRFLVFETLFWLAATALFNFYQYRAGVIICAAFVVWYISTKEASDRFLVLLSGLPFQAITKLSSSMPSIAVLLYVFFIASYLFKTGMKIRRKSVVSLATLALLNGIAYVRYDTPLMSIISGAVSVCFAAVALAEFEKNESKVRVYEKFAWVFAIAMVVDIYAVTFFPQIPYYILAEKQEILDRIGRFCALNGDPNYYGQLITVAVGLMITMTVLYWKNQRYCAGISAAAFAIILTINGMRSVSKGYVAGIAAVLMLTIWFLVMEGRPTEQKPLYFLLFALLGSVALVLIVDVIIMPVLSSRTDSDLFTGRLGVWEAYFELFKDKLDILIFGTGFANVPIVVSDYFGHAEAAHNLYIEVLGDIGVVGLCAMCSLWSGAFRKANALISNITSLFFWGFLVTSFSLSASANDIMYFCVPLLSIAFPKKDCRF